MEVRKENFIRINTHPICIRVNTCYNVAAIRKGDTKDAIDTQRNAQTSKEKWI